MQPAEAIRKMKEEGQKAILYSGDVRAKNVQLTQERETILRNFKGAHEGRGEEGREEEYAALRMRANRLAEQLEELA